MESSRCTHKQPDTQLAFDLSSHDDEDDRYARAGGLRSRPRFSKRWRVGG